MSRLLVAILGDVDLPADTDFLADKVKVQSPSDALALLAHPPTPHSFISCLVVSMSNLPEPEAISLFRQARAEKRVFIVAHYPAGTLRVLSRASCVRAGCNMVTETALAIRHALHRIMQPPTEGARHRCPVCELGPFHAAELWHHMGLYHSSAPCEIAAICPLCHRSTGIVDHIRREHLPPDMPEDSRAHPPLLYAFGLVMVRRSDGRFLLVQERLDEGFWLPGGHVDPAESPIAGAAREVLEEAGIEVNITGLLQVNYSPSPRHVRVRFILYGTPKNEQQCPKEVPDFESSGAVWATLEEIRELGRANLLRGDEPLQWAGYISRGGNIGNIQILSNEGAPPPPI
ncbi:putative NUDIX hydrolase [Paratrimastix pyriformis]|uniref:NUDIX hydrolase n=1 Tax=Paratrimastix pyriformis TaxID=342808 RepID=A0ABQ8UQJ5_9EUKA|nr:putative NUDIX hydrolase [Paratrimastix pyriformis]